MTDTFEPDVIVVGAGLAGLVATHEPAAAGHRVLVLDQENRDQELPLDHRLRVLGLPTLVIRGFADADR